MEQQSLEQQQLVIRLWRDPVGVSELIFQTWQVLCQNRVVEIKVQYFLEKKNSHYVAMCEGYQKWTGLPLP